MNGIGSNGAPAVNVFTARLRVKFDGSYACSILTAVMLLFHEQEKFVQAVQFAAVFLFVIRQWLKQPYQCNTTFMLYKITHGNGVQR